MACGSAILGLYFAVTESFMFHMNDGRLPDEAVTTAAGGWERWEDRKAVD
jgi:hypothetical protein